jgi:hypothetical protein
VLLLLLLLEVEARKQSKYCSPERNHLKARQLIDLTSELNSFACPFGGGRQELGSDLWRELSPATKIPRHYLPHRLSLNLSQSPHGVHPPATTTDHQLNH